MLDLVHHLAKLHMRIVERGFKAKHRSAGHAGCVQQRHPVRRVLVCKHGLDVSFQVIGVTHAQSHDSDYAARKELQHAFYFLRDGLGLLYTDGNYQAETLGESGGAFPRHSNTSFLGQWGDGRVPNLLYVHEQFARGYQLGRFSDADVVVWERLDKRENGAMSDADAVTLLVMLSDNYGSGQARSFASAFPAGAYLYNYSWYGGGFYKFKEELSSTVLPAGGYFLFS